MKIDYDVNLKPFLEDLESRLDPEQEEKIQKSWIAFADGESESSPFEPYHRRAVKASVDWPEININDAINNESLIILSQFKIVSDLLSNEGGALPFVRSNYGVGIIPTMFGAEVFMMDRNLNCLPNVRNLTDTQINNIIGSDFPKLADGFGGRVLSTGEKFLEIMAKYPNIGRCVRLEHPDCQGPFDLTELLYGSELFVAMYDDDAMIHALLRKLTDFYLCFMNNWFSLAPNKDDYHIFFGRMHRGSICVRMTPPRIFQAISTENSFILTTRKY